MVSLVYWCCILADFFAFQWPDRSSMKPLHRRWLGSAETDSVLFKALTLCKWRKSFKVVPAILLHTVTILCSLFLCVRAGDLHQQTKENVGSDSIRNRRFLYCQHQNLCCWWVSLPWQSKYWCKYWKKIIVFLAIKCTSSGPVMFFFLYLAQHALCRDGRKERTRWEVWCYVSEN